MAHIITTGIKGLFILTIEIFVENECQPATINNN